MATKALTTEFTEDTEEGQNPGNSTKAPGPEYKEVAVNRLETMLPPDWPVGPQEVASNAAPVFDGDRLYLRGEKFLYCIGRK